MKMNARIRNLYLTLQDAIRVADAPDHCGNPAILRQAQQTLVNHLSSAPGDEPRAETALRHLNRHLSAQWEKPRRMLRWESGAGNLSITWERVDHVGPHRPRAVFEAMLEHGLLSAVGTDGDQFNVEY